jgi:Skp family chaperone for outer membrane proteins
MNTQWARLRRSAGILAVAGFIIVSSAWETSAQPKIGIVDLARAMQQSIPGKAALASLKKTFDDLRGQLTRKAESIRTMERQIITGRQEIQQKSLLFSEAVRRQKEDELIKRQREFERSRDDLVRRRREAEADFDRERARVTRQVQGEIRDVITQIAKREKYTLILERSVVLFFDSEKTDLTDNVIDGYNKAKK